jgi:NitT/TauT family transport system substrate-binding protein
MKPASLLGPMLLVAVLAACGGTLAPAGGSAPSSTGSAKPSPPASSPSARPSASASATGQTSGSYAPTPLSPAVHVKFGAPMSTGEAGIFTAVDRGYFKDEGIDPELVPINVSPDIITQVVGGNIQFGSGALDPSLFNAEARGISIKVVGYNVITNESSLAAGFLVRTDLLDSGRWKQPKDFEGMTFGIVTPPGAMSDVYLDRAAQKYGFAFDKVKTQFLPYSEMPAAMANKALDALYTFQPSVSLIESQGTGKMVVKTGEIFPGVPGELLTMSPSLAQQQPEVVMRVMSAYLRGQRDVWHAIVKKDASVDDIYKIVANHTPLKDPNLIAKALTSTIEPNGEMDASPLSYVQDEFVKFGTAKQKIDVNQVVDSSFARTAVQRIGRVNA